MNDDTPTTTKLFYLRQKLSKRIGQVQELEKELSPPAVQELVLVRRHLEDARMRVGVAMAYLNGDNPWESPSPKQRKENKTDE